jgi:hypothetical protein
VSFADQNAGAQPAEGQGGGGGESGGAPYQSFLDRIQDEEARSIAEEGFKSFDSNVAKKFSEHAAYRKQWAPYEELGLRDTDPQMVQWAMQLAQAAQTNPQQFYEWVNGDYASQYGLAQQQQPDEYGGYEDPNQQLVQRMEQLEQMLSGVDGRFQQQEMQAAQQDAMRMIEGQIAKIEKEAGDAFDREALEMVLPHFTETAQTREELENAVPRAWEALQGLLNKTEQRTFAGKLNAGRAPEGSGMPDVTPNQAHNLKDAYKQAMDIARRGGM